MLLRLPGAIEMTVAHVVENDDRLNQTKKHYRKSLHIEIVTQKILALPLLSGCQQPGSGSCGCSDKPFPPAVRLPVTNIIGKTSIGSPRFSRTRALCRGNGDFQGLWE